MIDLKGEGADVREGKGKGEEEKKWELGTGVCYSSWHFWAAGRGNKDMESRRMGKETCLCAGCHAAAETRVQEQGGHK